MGVRQRLGAECVEPPQRKLAVRPGVGPHPTDHALWRLDGLGSEDPLGDRSPAARAGRRLPELHEARHLLGWPGCAGQGAEREQHVRAERFERGAVVDFREHEVVRRRAQRGRHDALSLFHDRQVGSLAEGQRILLQTRAEPEDQVVLGLARRQELARVLQELGGVLVAVNVHEIPRER